MHYYGDYHFDDFLEKGLEGQPKAGVYIRNDRPVRFCSTFSSFNAQRETIFGHNIDCLRTVMLLLFIHSPDGVDSVSVVSVGNLGYSRENPWLESTSLEQRLPLLNAPYLPHEGMNAYGVAIAEMTTTGKAGNDPQKKTLGSLHSIRLVLDYAKSVDEAIDLLRSYNQDRGLVHYLLADASGQSAVVEYVEGEMVVTRNRDPWQVATNFIIDKAAPDTLLDRCDRYKTAYTILRNARGNISQTEAMDVLKSVAEPYARDWPFATQWSAVYNLKTGTIDAVVGRQFEHIFRFNLSMQHNHSQ